MPSHDGIADSIVSGTDREYSKATAEIVQDGAHYLSRGHACTLLTPLLALLCLWLWLLPSEGAFRWEPNGSSFGTDFAMFFGAAQALREGGNPYDRAAVYHAENALFKPAHLPLAQARYIRVANPPLFYLALAPITRLPWSVASYLWIIGMYVSSLLGFIAVLRYFGWKHRLLPCLIFLAMPEVVFGAYYGNVDGVVFAAVGYSLLVLESRPALAGALLSVTWLKPQVGIPVVILFALYRPTAARRFLAGFCATTGLMLSLTVSLTGLRSLHLWAVAMLGFSHSATTYYDVASLSTLWSALRPTARQFLLQVAVVLTACGLTLWRWEMNQGSRQTSFLSWSWLWPVWLLATPFVHFHDEILLAIPLVSSLGPDGQFLSRPPSIAALYVAALSVLLISIHPFHAQLAWVGPAGMAVCLLVGVERSRLTTPRQLRLREQPET